MNFPIEATHVVPHSSRMLLIDSVLDADENSLTANARIREDNPFVRDGVMGSWVIVEYMAQAIAAFEGCRARSRGDKPKVGFLIGTRHFTSTAPTLALGSQLQLRIVRQYEEGGLGLFEGVMTSPDVTANASISVYQPDNAQEFLLENRA